MIFVCVASYEERNSAHKIEKDSEREREREKIKLKLVDYV